MRGLVRRWITAAVSGGEEVRGRRRRLRLGVVMLGGGEGDDIVCKS